MPKIRIDWNNDLDVKAAAEYLGVTVAALNNRRYQGTGPKFLKEEGKVRYRKTDLDKWMAKK